MSAIQLRMGKARTEWVRLGKISIAVILWPLIFYPVLASAEDEEAVAQSEGGEQRYPWEFIRYAGREHVELQDISNFYQMTYRSQKGKETTLLGNQLELSVTQGSRSVRVNGVYHWLSFPAVQRGGDLLISKLDLVETVEPALRPHFIQELKPVDVVVLDPGHGGHDGGAVSRYGREKEYALDVALKAQEILLEKGYEVVMTRSDDRFLSLVERAQIANRLENDRAVFISIHFNSATFSDEANGFEAFALTPQGAPSTMDSSVHAYHHKKNKGNPVDNSSLALSTCVLHSVLAHMERKDRGVKRQRFAVLKLTEIPSVLLECGFLNNREESRVVATEKWRQRLAYAIAQGVQDFDDMATTRQPPRTRADYRGVTGGVFQRRDGQVVLAPDEPTVTVPSGNTAESDRRRVRLPTANRE